LELTWIDAEPQPASRPAPAPTPVKKIAPSRRPAEAATLAPASPANPGVGEPATSAPAPSTEVADAPRGRGLILVPSAGFGLSLPGAGRNEPSRGTTLRNGPGEAPDPEVEAEYRAEVLSRRLTADLQRDVGRAALEVGNVPAHFKHYEAALRSALPGARIDRTPMTDGEVLRDVAGIVFNEGPSAEASRRVSDTAFGRSLTTQNVMLPNAEDQRFREQALQMLAQFENVKERISRARLRTVLELTTDASGALADVSIVERSGDRRFDESVLHFSRKVARDLPDRDDRQLGTSRWRTRWQFTWEPPDVRVRLIEAWRLAD
jgi:TonB family protein